jgi:hypothetical protein
MITLADVTAAAGRIQGRVIRTPMLDSASVSRATGAHVSLKLDNLQATGAFKERGAANRLAMFSAEERARGVIAMSAGNHAQAVARHAQLLGIQAVIVMPKHTPLTKVTRTAGWGARVVLHGDTLAEAHAHSLALAQSEGLVFVHPYDDPGVMAGQGTMALEMLEDRPELDALVIPVGGGGLIQLPAMLIGIGDRAPATILGTNKLSSIIGTSAAATTYLRRKESRPEPVTVLVMSGLAFGGSFGGAKLATMVPQNVFRPLVLVLLSFFVMGVAVGAIGMVPRWWKHRRLAQLARAEATEPQSSAPTSAGSTHGT